MKRAMFFSMLILLIGLYTSSAQTTHSITLQSNQPPQLIANAGNDTAFTAPGNYYLGGQPPVTGGVFPYRFKWVPDTDLNSDSVATPLFTHDGSYPWIEFILTVTDKRQCRAIDTVFIDLLYFSVESIEKPSMNIYPNPATDQISIDLPQAGGEITLYTIDGSAVIKQSATSSSIELQVGELSRGIYILKYTTDKGAHTLKVVLK